MPKRLHSAIVPSFLCTCLLIAGVGCGGSTDGSPPTAATTQEPFSFFVTSYAALQRLSGTELGFGGDLRFGETGAGAGLRGADKICSAIADVSRPGSISKGWRAFLSVADDGTGQSVNAIDRIGAGPWYDRVGRLFGNSVQDIKDARPRAADAAIANDLPNEDGIPNHQPNLNAPPVDNHRMLTGSTPTGTLFVGASTCLDWTSAEGNVEIEGAPRVGDSWPRAITTRNEDEQNDIDRPNETKGEEDKDGGVPKVEGSRISALTASGCKAGVGLLEEPDPADAQPVLATAGDTEGSTASL